MGINRWNAEHYVCFASFMMCRRDPVRKAGKCAFASRNITKCAIICEYEGELLTVEEAKAREESYREEGKVCALMVFESAGRQIA